MSPEAVEMLRAAVDKAGSQTVVARALGISPSAVSLLLKGKYQAKSTAAMEARVRGLGGIDCPYLGARVTLNHCWATALGACPTHTPEALAAWRASQSCLHRPPAPAAQAAGRPTRKRRHAER